MRSLIPRLALFFAILILALPRSAFADKGGKPSAAHADADDNDDKASAKDDEGAAAKGAHKSKEKEEPEAAGEEGDKAPAEKPAAHEGPVTMHVGVELVQLSKFEVGPGTFNAEFYVSVRCDAEPCSPEPDVANGKVTGKEKVVDEKLRKQFKMKAELSGLVDLSEFPFDEHVLPIQIADKKNPAGVIYVLDAEQTSIDPGVKLAGWEPTRWLADVEKHKLDDGRELSEFQYGVFIRRPIVSAIFKSFVPVLFMVFVAGFSLLLKPKSAAGRLATATGGLMSVVMFHLGATSSLPPMGYLTRLDKFLIATYLVYIVNIAFSVAMVRFEERKDEKKAELAYLAATGAVPGIALIAWVTVFFRVI